MEKRIFSLGDPNAITKNFSSEGNVETPVNDGKLARLIAEGNAVRTDKLGGVITELRGYIKCLADFGLISSSPVFGPIFAGGNLGSVDGYAPRGLHNHYSGESRVYMRLDNYPHIIRRVTEILSKNIVPGGDYFLSIVESSDEDKANLALACLEARFHGFHHEMYDFSN